MGTLFTHYSLMKKTYVAYFRTAGSILIITGCIKIISLFNRSPIMWTEDPMFGIPIRPLLCVVGIWETFAGLICWFDRNMFRSSCVVAATSLCLMMYRILLTLMGEADHCPCLGYITDWLRLAPHTVGAILWSILWYLFVGSGFFVACNLLRNLRQREPV